MEKTRLKQAADAMIALSCREVIAILEMKCAAIEEELTRRIEANSAIR